MPTLGSYKPRLLDQLRNQASLNLDTLKKLLQQYDDLRVEDLRAVVQPSLYDQLLDSNRDPKEVADWGNIANAPHDTPEQVRALMTLVDSYLRHYPGSPKAVEAQSLQNSLGAELTAAEEERRRREEAAREQGAWDRLDRHSYSSLMSYRGQYPNTVHLDEIDDLCWEITKTQISMPSLSRYLADWPFGRHVDEAGQTTNTMGEWEEIRREGNLFRVAEYRKAHPDSPLKNEINRVFYDMRDKELTNMRESPNEYDKDILQRFFDSNVFSMYELIDNGLLTDESWETLNSELRDYLPEVSMFQVPNPDLQAPAECTDIYLFGTPGTGKTCLLMGLAGADGRGYTLNMRVHGGPYASALKQFVNAGLTPGRTFGSYVTVINGNITTEMKRDVFNSPINLVEMSGEEFALHISEGDGVSLSDMGTGATNLLSNPNRKAFFIIVDATKDQIKFEYEETIYDDAGNRVDVRRRKRYISQLDIIDKFIGLFELPENKAIMDRVDAIHFIVTKADTLGDISVRDQAALKLLTDIYAGPVEKLKALCRRTKRINFSTNYRPQLFTFSLGQFYLGDVFKFNNTDTLKIINAMRQIVHTTREETWWDRFCRKMSGNS